MNEPELILLIAEELGMVRVKGIMDGAVWDPKENRTHLVPGSPIDIERDRIGLHSVPPFLLPELHRDLNTCHRLEALLTDEEFARYMQNLGMLINERTDKSHRLCDRLPCHAKAEWRTETWLRLKGKWTE